MGRSPCCEKEGLKKGPWTPEEDQKLLLYIEENGHGSWRALPAKAGLQRCGKSCRLRWTNYLRPDIKRGKFSLQEEQTIIQLHALLGNRWSAIATHLPKRTDNEIKNYWNTHLKKRLAKMGIDPVTHKPKTDALGPCQLKDAANLSHMAQWESARLQAEARLVRESKVQVPNPFQTRLGSTQPFNKAATLPPPPPPRPQSLCLDVLTAWQGAWLKTPKDYPISGGIFAATTSLESPTSTLNFSGNAFPVGSFPTNALPALEYVTNSGACEAMAMKFPELKGKMDHAMHFHHDMAYSTDGLYIADSLKTASNSSTIILPNFMEGLADLLVENNDALNPSNPSGNSSDNLGGSFCGGLEDNKNYWNSILNLVNCSPTGSSPVF